MSGEQLKQDGIAAVLEAEDEGWHARATGLYREYMATHADFTAEDCKRFARVRGLREPHHHNVWGGIWSRIARTKAIVKTGQYVKSDLSSRHANEVPVWRKTNKF